MNLFLLMLLSLGFLETVSGTGEFLSPTARSIGLANSAWGISDSVTGYIENPSLLSLREGISAYLDGDFGYHSETHSRWVFDRFDNTIGEEAVYSAATSYLNTGTFSISYGMENMGVGFSTSRRADYGYRYERTDRTDVYTVVSRTIRRIRGGIRDFSLSLGYRPLEWLSFGISGSYFHGARWDTLIVDSVYKDSLYEDYSGGKFNGMGVNIGLYVTPTRYIDLGVTYSPKASLKGDIETNYPELLSFVFSFRPPSKWPTEAFLSFSYRNWHLESINPKRTLSVGFLHYTFSGTEFRFGASLENDSKRGKYWYPGYSLGVGHHIGDFRVDIGFEMKPKDYRYRIDDGTERIEETITHFKLGVGYTF